MLTYVSCGLESADHGAEEDTRSNGHWQRSTYEVVSCVVCVVWIACGHTPETGDEASSTTSRSSVDTVVGLAVRVSSTTFHFPCSFPLTSLMLAVTALVVEKAAPRAPEGMN